MENILLTSLKECIHNNSIYKFLFGSTITSIVGVMLIGKNMFNTSIKDSLLYSTLAIIGLFIIRFFYYLTKNIIRYIHNTYVDSIYKEFIICLKEINSQLQLLRKNTEFNEEELKQVIITKCNVDATVAEECLKTIQKKVEINDEEFMTAMVNLCNMLKDVFDKKTKANCSVSIKVPISNPELMENIILKNLCRDKKHHARSTDKYKQIKHTIIGNTPYRYIVNNVLQGNKKKFGYVNNNIEDSKDYENTSREAYDDGILPYKSEIVYPITPSLLPPNQRRKMYGFVCVDCDKTNRFEANSDIHIIEGVADSIYDIIQVRISLNNN
ncbi:hypothetical protein [Parabacteroides faecis]|uniref:hypothetical protein n=1 Tax=Parabacteroides faecis TaxID=1217282 RepID=UPI003522763B